MLLSDLDSTSKDMLSIAQNDVVVNQSGQMNLDLRIPATAGHLPDSVVLWVLAENGSRLVERIVPISWPESVRQDSDQEHVLSLKVDSLFAGIEGSGRLRLEWQVRQGSNALASGMRWLYYSASSLELRSLMLVPHTLLPAAQSVAIVDVLNNDDVPLSLRWSLRGQVLAFGPARKGLNRLVFDSPSQGGIYELKVEAFPVADPSLVFRTDSSSIAVGTSLSVSTRPMASSRSQWFSPRAAYDRLYFLEGDTRSWALQDQEAPALLREGKPAFNLLPSFSQVAYTLGQGDYLRTDPAVLLDERGLPRTQSWDLLVHTSDAPEAMVFMEALDGRGQVILSLGRNAQGLPQIAVRPGIELKVFTAEAPLAPGLSFMRLGLLRQGGRLLLSLRANDQLIIESALALPAPNVQLALAQAVETRLGNPVSAPFQLLGFGHVRGDGMLEDLAMYSAVHRLDGSTAKLLSIAQGERFTLRFAPLSNARPCNPELEIRARFVDAEDVVRTLKLGPVAGQLPELALDLSSLKFRSGLKEGVVLKYDAVPWKVDLSITGLPAGLDAVQARYLKAIK